MGKVLVVIVTVFLGACVDGKNPTEKKENSNTSKEDPKHPTPGFDIEGLTKSWQGSWVVGGWASGKPLAWEVKNDKVLIYDGQRETEYNFKIDAPCRAEVYTDDLNSRWLQKFVFVNDSLYSSGLGSAGLVMDNTIVVCTKGWVITYTEGKCQQWNEAGPDWFIAEDGECSLEEDIFKVRLTKNLFDELELTDGVLLDQEMKSQKAIKTQNFTEAKKIIDAK